MFDDLRELYQEVILDHGRAPRHGHRLAVFDTTAKGDNPMCGDRVQVWVRLDEMKRIAQTGFEARGCAISVASADLMAEAVAGRTSTEAKRLFADFATMVRTGNCPDCDAAMESLRVFAGVHEFPSRVKCATLPWHALTAALDGGQEVADD
ncbi:MAG TPA: SUF system NifU family Fe-S cluster assembly protein [Acetobacteraceae bacterium]|nr:SUF system NifU family Fe-S cluster assembly protein [Acetobacteraceae bacterium]